MTKELTEKQKRFAEEYVVDLNATQAAIRAGYSARTAGAVAHKLLKKAEIQALIQELQQARSGRTGITQDRTLTEIARIALFDPAGVLSFEGDTITVRAASEITEDARRAIKSIRIRKTIDGAGNEVEVMDITFHDKTRNLELLGRHLGMFVDRIKHEGDGVAIRFIEPVKPETSKSE